MVREVTRPGEGRRGRNTASNRFKTAGHGDGARRKPAPKKGGDAASAAVGGLGARDCAVSALYSVFVDNRAFDDAFDKAAETRGLESRDRAFARLIAMTVLRHHGELTAVVGRFLEKGLPPAQARLQLVLIAGAAQLLFLKTPPHAAISLAVDQARLDKSARRFDKLTNAVLRRVSEKGEEILASLDPVACNIPDWLLERWRGTFGDDKARAIALASLGEAALDITVKSRDAADAAKWAGELGGIVLPTGTIRLQSSGRIEELAGYDAGAWWVQDAAAALPARLLGDVRGLDIADLCAAPGGKTAQLAAAGAQVTAVDKSPGRLRRLEANLRRLNLEAKTQVGDAAEFAPGRLFDGILVDAPCTATGTIRRHPDILALKRPEDVAALAALQARILDRAAQALKPGGVMVYCTCSLEAEEGEGQIGQFLAAHSDFRRLPIDPAQFGFDASWVTAEGDLRTLPCHLGDLAEGLTGMDGFFAARLVRTA